MAGLSRVGAPHPGGNFVATAIVDPFAGEHTWSTSHGCWPGRLVSHACSCEPTSQKPGVGNPSPDTLMLRVPRHRALALHSGLATPLPGLVALSAAGRRRVGLLRQAQSPCRRRAFERRRALLAGLVVGPVLDRDRIPATHRAARRGRGFVEPGLAEKPALTRCAPRPDFCLAGAHHGSPPGRGSCGDASGLTRARRCGVQSAHGAQVSTVSDS